MRGDPDFYSVTCCPFHQIACVYEDFFQTARNVLNAGISDKLRKALDFKFRDEGHIRYPKDRIILLEKQIQNRVSRILKRN